MVEANALTQARLRELLDYDPDTGIFTWRVSRGGQRAGSVAGSVFRQRTHRTNYIRIRIDGAPRLSHRLAWLFVHGECPATIDHADGDGTNNRINNLRPANVSENQANAKMRKDNTSGFKGVTALRKCWKASIRKNGKKIYLGTFDTPESAHAAYCKAAAELHGKFANYGAPSVPMLPV